MTTPRRNIPVLIVAVFFCACVAASDVFGDTFDRRSGMISDSVVYLQKSIPAAETERDTQNITVRIAPIVTVTAGLLDAGVAPDEPLVQSGLRFLRRFYDDNKSRELRNDAALTALLAKIEACLAKASQGISSNDSKDDSTDETAFLLRALDSLDDSEATARAVGFVQKINGETSNDDAHLDETRYVVSPGVGDSIRVREWRQAMAELDGLPIRDLCPVDRWSPEQFDGLIACVHGLKHYPPLPGSPSRPEPLSAFAAISPLPRLTDSRKTISGQQGPLALYAFNIPLPGHRGLSQTLSQTLLSADSLAALQTVRRLE